MIIRQRFLPSWRRAREEIWQIIDAVSQQLSQAPEDDVRAQAGMWLTVSMWRYAWCGPVIECLWALASFAISALVAVVPLPVRVYTYPRGKVWRVQWLGWVFAWGVPKPPEVFALALPPPMPPFATAPAPLPPPLTPES